MDRIAGHVVQIQGGVVDVEFPEGSLPEVFEGVEIPREGKDALVLEVENHLGNHWVRCLAMDTTDGLQREIPAYRTGSAIKVPVGPATLGRIFNVLGRPIDHQGPVASQMFYPIHRPAPSFEEQATRVDVFETGIKSGRPDCTLHQRREDWNDSEEPAPERR